MVQSVLVKNVQHYGIQQEQEIKSLHIKLALKSEEVSKLEAEMASSKKLMSEKEHENMHTELSNYLKPLDELEQSDDNENFKYSGADQPFLEI